VVLVPDLLAGCVLVAADPMTIRDARVAGCSLCGDTDGRLFLHARCHPSAPLRAVKDGDVLILRCYLPDCDREVARLRLASNSEKNR
jgi:hypothetical protein